MLALLFALFASPPLSIVSDADLPSTIDRRNAGSAFDKGNNSTIPQCGEGWVKGDWGEVSMATFLDAEKGKHPCVSSDEIYACRWTHKKAGKMVAIVCSK